MVFLVNTSRRGWKVAVIRITLLGKFEGVDDYNRSKRASQMKLYMLDGSEDLKGGEVTGTETLLPKYYM